MYAIPLSLVLVRLRLWVRFCVRAHTRLTFKGAQVTFPARAWQKSDEPIDGKHFYYDANASKSQWLVPVIPKGDVTDRLGAVVILSSTYVAFVDKVAQDDRHSTTVVDCAVVVPAVQTQPQQQQQINQQHPPPSASKAAIAQGLA